MTDQLISNKKILITGIVIIALLFYFQDSLPDEITVQGIKIPEIKIPYQETEEEITRQDVVDAINQKVKDRIESESPDPIPDLIEVPPEEVMLEPSKVINLNEQVQKTGDELVIMDSTAPPQFTSFKEEIEWYSLFEETRVTYPELKDVPLECDPLIREYKSHTDFAIKSHLSKKILEVCDLA